MNKGVANMWRYFQVGIQANRRYLDALAAAPVKGKGVAALDALCRSRTNHGHHHARFNPLSPSRPRAVPCRPGRRSHHRRLPQLRPLRPLISPSPN